MTPLLDIRGLRTYFNTEAGVAKAVDGVNLSILPGEVLGLVGESGSGKSVTALSMLRLIPEPPGKIVAGEIFFKGRDLLKLDYNAIRDVRGREISMIFQEPMTSLNPVFRIGMQLMEVYLQHEHISKREAFDRSVEMLRLVGRQPGISVRAAATELGLAPNTASTLVSKLAADGLLIRTVDAEPWNEWYRPAK